MILLLFIPLCLWIGFVYSTIKSDNDFSRELRHKEILKEINDLPSRYQNLQKNASK